MEFWQKARTFAEEAAKRSQEITIGSSKLSVLVTETTRRSKEIAAEASKQADRIKIEAIKRADQIKSLTDGISRTTLAEATAEEKEKATEAELERFGVTEELREFVKEITINTFQDFPLPDDSEMSNVPTVSNVRQDLTEWQMKHANLVLTTVKEISKLRYELCPRAMKERKFWRIYFILVNNHVAPYEKRYMEEAKLTVKDDQVEKPSKSTGKTDNSSQQIKSASSATEQDLDVFLLGGDSDDGADDGDLDFDDDLDKMVNSSDDEKKS